MAAEKGPASYGISPFCDPLEVCMQYDVSTIEVPVALTPQEIRALLEAIRETPYYVAGQTSAADKFRAALK